MDKQITDVVKPGVQGRTFVSLLLKFGFNRVEDFYKKGFLVCY